MVDPCCHIDPSSIHDFKSAKRYTLRFALAAAVWGRSNFDWFAAAPRVRLGMVAMVEVGFQMVTA